MVSCSKIKHFDCGDSVKDMDGNVYHTVNIGTQCWMLENLKTSKYNDGTDILTNFDNTAWRTTTYGVCAIYYNNEYENRIYGKLYNWYAVNTAKLAPKDWHVPDTTEWNTLINFLGGESVAGDKMKETTSWLPFTGISNTNSSGFTGLPGGNRDNNTGFYEDLLHSAYFWTSSEFSPDSAYTRILHYNSSVVDTASYSKHSGLSVRCIKD